MYESSKVFWEKWSECVRSVWTVFVTWTALEYESCKILREKWSLVTWIPFVQLYQGRFLLWSESSLDILWKERKTLTIVNMKFLNLFICFSRTFSYKSRQYLYLLIFSAAEVLIYLFFTLLKMQRGIGVGGACMLLFNGKGLWSSKFLAVQACKPIYTLNTEHENLWTRYVESITFILKNKNNFIFHTYLLTYLLHGAESFLRS